jgi:carbonic anhydrase
MTGDVREPNPAGSSGRGEVTSPLPDDPAAAEALECLLAGNRRFTAEARTFPDQTPARRQELVAGQKPFVAILSCSDSRVVPEIIFDQGLGDLFVVRVAGNVVDPALRASVEYAVRHLAVPLILVLGHTSCGAVTAALAAEELGDEAAELAPLLSAIEPAIALARQEVGDSDPARLLAAAVRANVRLAVSPLNPAPGVEVVGAVYDLTSGVVEVI